MRIILILGCAVMFLAGCGAGTAPPTNGSEDLYVEYVNVDGKDVPCVIYADGRYEQGGVSCNFNSNDVP